VQIRIFDGRLHETKQEARASFLKQYPEPDALSEHSNLNFKHEIKF